MRRSLIDKMMADIKREARDAEIRSRRGNLRSGADALASSTGDTSAVSLGDANPGERARPEPRRVDGPIIGYRIWNLHYWLYPMQLMGYRDTPWERTMPAAKCSPWGYGGVYVSFAGTYPPQTPTCQAAPGWDCACGYNALTELPGLSLWQRAPTMPDGSTSDGPAAATMIGIVAGWGRVILHSDGWRSERARVLALVGLDRNLVDPTLLDSADLYLQRAAIIAKHLDVPVLAPEQARAFVSEFTEARNV